MAKRFKVEMPAEVERFFDVAATGRWGDLTNMFATLQQERHSDTNSEALKSLWGAVHETFGVAEVAHNWPAQRLLDYGEAVLGSLRPGMVYVGGTDAGRFIPTLVNETSDGERHIVLTQNALADGSYRDYVSFLYGDQMSTLSEDDSKQAFQDYISDAQNRLTHDQQSPDEPKQLRPGEDIRTDDGRVQVSGQVAVMMVNEKMLQAIMDKNPNLSFAIEESFPLKSTYPNAAPLGPVMELGVPDVQETFTADSASQAVEYWQDTSRQLLADSGLSPDSDVLREYSKMAGAQASLMASHNLNTQADQAYQVANEICPGNPETVFSYVSFLMGQQRVAEAVPVAEAAVNAAPNNQQFRDLLDNLKAVAAKR